MALIGIIFLTKLWASPSQTLIFLEGRSDTWPLKLAEFFPQPSSPSLDEHLLHYASVTNRCSPLYCRIWRVGTHWNLLNNRRFDEVGGNSLVWVVGLACRSAESWFGSSLA